MECHNLNTIHFSDFIRILPIPFAILRLFHRQRNLFFDLKTRQLFPVTSKRFYNLNIFYIWSRKNKRNNLPLAHRLYVVQLMPIKLNRNDIVRNLTWRIFFTKNKRENVFILVTTWLFFYPDSQQNHDVCNLLCCDNRKFSTQAENLLTISAIHV